MTRSRVEEQALRSAAHLVAALADRRFGMKGALSSELKDSISVLRDELDSLGLLAEYRQADGSLAAWRPDDDGNITTALRRASFKDDKPSNPAYLYRVLL
jgi:hypothetical protein